MKRRFGQLLATALLAALALPTAASAARPSKVLFSQTTPGTYAFVVPKGMKRLTFELYGASGGRGGGLGGKTTATFAVQPGQTFEIVVGGQGADTSTAGSNGGGTGASDTTNLGGGGGGATDVRGGSCTTTTSCGLIDRFLVAGGGGGGANQCNVDCPGGAGGGLVGGDGTCDPFATPALGATQTAGGRGGNDTPDLVGAFGTGGSAVAPGGGGGGGWFGGGAGWLGSGGGGSGYISGSALSGSMTAGIQSGNGMAVIRSAG